MSLFFDEKLENSIIDSLFELGLNTKESRIYLALITLGQVGTTKICELTGLHRQYVYQFLGTLEKKGLVQNVLIRGRKKFSAKSPEILSRLLDEKKNIADRVIKDIALVVKLPAEQAVQVNQGEESYIISAFDLIKRVNKGSEILIIGGYGDRFVKILSTRLNEYEKIRVEKQISIRYLGSEKQRGSLENNTRKLFSYRLLPGDFTDITHTVAFDSFISLDTFGTPIMQTVINNPSVAEGQKQFFESLWSLGK
jgi:sugar-specific transcriptional regulator TrmB